MKRNIYLMYAIAFLQGMVFYGPVATLYRQACGVSVFQITVIESISLFLCILLEVAWGVAADRIGYKKTMVFCCVLYFLSKIVFWRASGFGGFLAERVMLSIVIAGLSGVDTSILYLSCQRQNKNYQNKAESSRGEGESGRNETESGWSEGEGSRNERENGGNEAESGQSENESSGNGIENSQQVFGMYNSLQMAGLLAASAVFSLFVGENYRLAGFLTALSYGGAAVLSLGLTEVSREGAERICFSRLKETLVCTLKDRRLLLFLLAVALLTETHQTVTVFLNQLQYEKCGLGNAAIGYIYIAATLLGMCGVYSARLTKKAGFKAAGLLFGGTAACSCAMLALSAKALPSVCAILVLRISNSLFQPFQTEIQNRLVHTEYRATALSIHAMLLDSVGVGTNLAFGALAEHSLTAAFWFGAGVCMTGAVMMGKLLFTPNQTWNN